MWGKNTESGQNNSRKSKDTTKLFQGRALIEKTARWDMPPRMSPMMPEIKPFPARWLKKYTNEQLERLAIMTVDGELTDEEAEKILEKEKGNGRSNTE